MRVSSDKMGLIEDNRYANIINQHLQTFQKGRAEVSSNNYYGSGNKFVVVNDEFRIRLPISDVCGMATTPELFNNSYVGKTRFDIELEDKIEVIYQDSENTGREINIVDGTATTSADELVSVLVYSNANNQWTAESLGLILSGQSYNCSYTLGGAQNQVITVSSVSEDTANNKLEITISPPITVATAGEKLTEVKLELIQLRITGWEITDAYLHQVMPLYTQKAPSSLEFVSYANPEVSNQSTDKSYVKQWYLTPDVSKVLLITPHETSLVSNAETLVDFRNDIDTFSTTNRSVVFQSSLWYDRLISTMDDLKCLSRDNRLNGTKINHIAENIPEDGKTHLLQTRLEYSGSPVPKPVFLYKKVMRKF
jgi:hypothetical protein